VNYSFKKSIFGGITLTDFMHLESSTLLLGDYSTPGTTFQTARLC